VGTITIVTIPEPTPIELEPENVGPEVPGDSTDLIDRRESNLDGELEDTFPASDPSSTWAGPDQ
jgi:hypothetical protein